MSTLPPYAALGTYHAIRLKNVEKCDCLCLLWCAAWMSLVHQTTYWPVVTLNGHRFGELWTEVGSVLLMDSSLCLLFNRHSHPYADRLFTWYSLSLAAHWFDYSSQYFRDPSITCIFVANLFGVQLNLYTLPSGPARFPGVKSLGIVIDWSRWARTRTWLLNSSTAASVCVCAVRQQLWRKRWNINHLNNLSFENSQLGDQFK